MDTIFDRITAAIRQQHRQGKTQTALARELHLPPTTVGAIIRGDRRLGRKSFEAILDHVPPWLLQHLREPTL